MIGRWSQVSSRPDLRPAFVDRMEPVVRYTPEQLRLYSHAHGRCNVCGLSTRFFYDPLASRREANVCAECGSTSRYRSLARGVLRALRELTGVATESLAELPERHAAQLRVYDTQVPFQAASCSYLLPDLLARCRWIDVSTSTYRRDERWGATLGRRCTNQDLERLTFDDETFDIVLTSDVLEHVRMDRKALLEIRRVLRLGGVHVFTVPHERDRPTLVRVATTDPEDPSKDELLMEPEYHGDANSFENRALAYRTYGTDIDDLLAEVGFEAEYEQIDVPETGIVDTELFYCRAV